MKQNSCLADRSPDFNLHKRRLEAFKHTSMHLAAQELKLPLKNSVCFTFGLYQFSQWLSAEEYFVPVSKRWPKLEIKQAKILKENIARGTTDPGY